MMYTLKEDPPALIHIPMLWPFLDPLPYLVARVPQSHVGNGSYVLNEIM